MTQEDLAGETELDRPFITVMEAGSKQPSLSVLWRLAAGLQISMSDLAMRVDERLARLSSVPQVLSAPAKKAAARRRT